MRARIRGVAPMLQFLQSYDVFLCRYVTIS